MGERVVLLK